MGLDQWVIAVKKDYGDTFNYTIPDDDDYERIYYWRKHPNLQGWMAGLYRSKGGKGIFNCVKVKLTSKDIKRLKDDVMLFRLPYTEGFFFGESTEEHFHEDLAFLKIADDYLSRGYNLYYTSWW